MIITLVPVRMDSTLTLIREGETLIINGERVDLSAAAEGAPLDLSQRDEAGDVVVPHPWIIGPVERRVGRLHLSLLLPHGADAPEAVRFPAPLAVEADGPVPLPGQDGAGP
ncbi:hypothetical protein ruthe_02159 [Rubellimicrobium thermophilum DSM 16684]|uniref:Uncharacterized protein n=1 Tax=Rubellimicrobium thermophilum DSM 16684 TaxID=1123069 RepID=S9SE00_9RHOB|nr:hypothetical protein [Rubellimicrobium thermophilum]EPX84479.1 hypothetical protein ruthe_02159 [Rubellimicrobium thermophilum DSM 16684]